nr:glycosyltransferase family 39 protein [Paludisphaera soli]
MLDRLSRPIDLAPFLNRLVELVSRRPLSACLEIGVALRVWVYLQGRPYWMDEGSLLANLRGVAPFDFSSPLKSDQLAPPAFLAAERLVVQMLGESPFATRLIPLACGLGSLWLFREVARRTLLPAAAVVAMFLFAVGDDLVYYSNELKPYSTDLAVGLLVTFASLKELQDPPSRRLRLGLAVLAVASPWVSFASVFVVAGCGLTLLVDALRSGRRGDAARHLGLAAAWAVSVLLAHRISSRMLVPATTMYVFWDFAFLPPAPTSRESLAKFAGILLETFVTPLNLTPRLMPYAFALFALAMTLLGARRLARLDARVVAILAVPIVLAMAASAARRYPFHGRLILGLAPAFFLLIAEGLQEIRCRRGRAWYLAALAFLLVHPTFDALYQAVPPLTREFNRHGDLRGNRFLE